MKKQNPKIRYYGTHEKDGVSERVHMSSFFNRLRTEYPETWGLLGLHIRNEGKRTAMQIQRIKFEGGFVKGAVDVIIPGCPTFVMEMKSRSKSSKISKEQTAYLTAAHNAGAFACVAFGAAAAWEAFEEWRKLQ